MGIDNMSADALGVAEDGRITFDLPGDSDVDDVDIEEVTGKNYIYSRINLTK